jgi:hypothetical protein
MNRRRRYLKLALWALVPALVVWIAPAIVAHSSLRQQIIDRATTKLRGRVSVGSASFGWVSPVRLYDVKLVDSQGETLLAAESIATGRSLLGLLMRRDDLGVVRVENPQAQVSLRADGSNWEDLIEPVLQEPSTGAASTLAIEIVNGSLVLDDAASGGQWRFENLDSTILLPATGAIEASLKGETIASASETAAGTAASSNAGFALGAKRETRANGAIGANGAKGQNGIFEAVLRWEAGSGAGKGQTTLKATQFPLDSLTPVLRRFVGPVALAGEATVEGVYDWDGAAHRLGLEKLAATNLFLQAEPWLGSDTLRLPRLESKGSVAFDGTRIEVRDLALASDIATLEAQGGVPLAALSGGANPAKWAALLSDEDFVVQGQLDLAQLARLFPSTLRIRQGTEITSGKLAVSLDSRQQTQGRQWRARLESSNLTALNDGRQVTWEQPVLVTLAASQGPRGPVVEQLECRSNFLRAVAKGTAAEGGIQLEGDLSRLASELSQFVDLGGTRLAGDLRGDLKWVAGETDRMIGRGEFTLAQFELTLNGSRPWRETALRTVLDVEAATAGGVVTAVHKASLTVAAEGDQLQATLAEPVAAPSTQSRWAVQGALQGELARWLPRLQAFLPLPGWDIGGQANLSATVNVGPDTTEIKAARGDIANFAVTGENLFLHEPQVQLELAGAWDATRRRFVAPTLTFGSSAIAFRADNLEWSAGSSDGKSDGGLAATIALRSELARLGQWLQDPHLPVAWQIAGMANGTVRLRQAGGETAAAWDLEVENFAYNSAASATPAGPPTIPAGMPTAGRPRGAAGVATAQLVTAGAAGGAGTVTPAGTQAAAASLKTVWAEPKLKWSGEGVFDAAKMALRGVKSRIDGDGVGVELTGTAEELTSRCLLALDGEIGYDLPRLTMRLREYLGPSMRLEGRDVRKFAVRGPILDPIVRTTPVSTGQPGRTNLDGSRTAAGVPGSTQAAGTLAWLPQALAAEAGLNWSAASVYGLPIGPGELRGRLADRVLMIDPLDIPVAEGRVRMAPRIHFDQAEPLMVADKGVVLENIRFSPELCAAWMKYVLPVVADVAEVQGQFSVELAQPAVVPLDRPADGALQGVMTVHGVQVGPSPVTRELISLAQTLKNYIAKTEGGEPAGNRLWLQIAEQSIPFHWQQRRVHHERLVFSVRDMAVITGGSVGADQTLNLIAEIPVRDEWLKNDRAALALKGQSMRIPIGGTLSRPAIDRQAFTASLKRMATDAAGKVLERELSRGIDQFLRPRLAPQGGAGGNNPAGAGPQANAAGGEAGGLGVPGAPNVPAGQAPAGQVPGGPAPAGQAPQGPGQGLLPPGFPQLPGLPNLPSFPRPR